MRCVQLKVGYQSTRIVYMQRPNAFQLVNKDQTFRNGTIGDAVAPTLTFIFRFSLELRYPSID